MKVVVSTPNVLRKAGRSIRPFNFVFYVLGLRAVKVGGRRTLRLRVEWIDAWLEAQEVPRRERPGR